jgi:serine/threonine protein kinase
MPFCPQCLTPLPDDAPEGLCPACLLKRGLENNTLPGNTAPSIDDQKSKIEHRKSTWTPPSLADLAPLFPDLDLLEFLGRGGMGAVYKARQKSLDRIVALKILPPAIGQDSAFADRFTHEAHALARLNHPHIVTIYDFGQREAPGLPGDQAPVPTPSVPQSLSASVPPPLYFFLMEFVDGLTLRQLISSRTLAPKDALVIVPQICDALQYAHDRGIIHRDIKPENILLTREGQIKIADFGLAKLINPIAGPETTGDAVSPPVPQNSELTTHIVELTLAAGTPAYMAPEQSQTPSAVDHRADIYALGVVFYQLLTGELPQTGGLPVPPSRKVQIDVRLDEIVLRALEKSPSLRYQNATQFKTEIETVLSAPPAPAAQPAGPPQPPPSEKSAPASSLPPPATSATPRSRAIEHLRIAAWLMGIVAAFNILIFLLVPAWRLLTARGEVFHYATDLRVIIPLALLLPINLFILISAVRMTHLRGYTPATVSCGLTLLAGNILGIPVAIWAFILLLRPDIRNAFDASARSSHGINRRIPATAIVGAICSLVPFLALLALMDHLHRRQDFVEVLARGNGPYFTTMRYNSLTEILSSVLHFGLYALGILSLIATPICGLFAIIRIRRSPTTLKGLPLALYDLLVVPLLALDFFIWLLLSLIMSYIVSVQDIRADFGQGSRITGHPALVWLASIVLSAILDTFIAWTAWLIVRPPKTKLLPSQTLPAPSHPTPGSSQNPATKPAAPPLSLKPPLLTAVAHICLLVLFVGFFSFVVPRQRAQFVQWDATLPVLTAWTLSFSHLIQHWFCVLAPPALLLVAGFPFAVHRLGGRIALLLYFILASIAPLLIMLIAGFSLLLPMSARAANSPAADLPYIHDAVADALLAEGYAANDVIPHLSPDGQSGSIDLPALCQLQGPTRADGTTPVQGSLDLVRFQPGLWNIAGKGDLRTFHIAVHTPRKQGVGMGPAPAFPNPPSFCASLLNSARSLHPSDPARATALLRQANVILNLRLGDPPDYDVAQQLAREWQMVLPTGLPTTEDLEAVDAHPLADDSFLQREVQVREPLIFCYRQDGQLAIVSITVTRNPMTNSLVVDFCKNTAHSIETFVLPQVFPPPPPDGSWSVAGPAMDQRRFTATRIAPGRFRIRVMPISNP